MSFPVRGPGWPVVTVATAAVVVLLGFSVSTQGPGSGRRIVSVNGAEAVEGEVLVKYRDGSERANQKGIEAAAEADTVETLDRRGARRMRSRRLRTVELLALLARDPDVEYVEPNHIVRLHMVPNDPSFASLWGLFNDGLNPVGGGGVSGADIDAPGAWDLTTGNGDHVVAVLDTGIDYTHPDLAANMWSAPGSFQVTIGGVTVTCAAGTHGFNVFTKTCNPMDDHFHGTHVAGTIGARGNNGAGVTGVNWTTSMMGVKILGSQGTATVAEALAGLEFVLQAKAAFASTGGADIRVLSNSWGISGGNQSVFDAIKATNTADMLFVAAAGNSSQNVDNGGGLPATLSNWSLTPNVVAVAASTSSDQLASFSNYGAATVNLAAPGKAILSTVPGGGYGIADGTSMAAPHVAGAAMLALSICEASTAQLKAALLASVDPVQAFSGITTTGGRLNARALVQNCANWKVSSLTVTPSVPSPQAAGTTVTFTAVAGGGQGPYEYRWFLWDGATSTIVQDWASTNAFVWTPTLASDKYVLTAQARSAWNKTKSEFSVTKPFAIKTPVSSVTLTSNLVAPQGLGATVTWTAAATGGQAPYQYRWSVWDGVSWVLSQDWSSLNTFAWTPGVANESYKVAVHVRSAWRTQGYDLGVAKPFAIKPRVSSVTLTPSLAAPQPPGKTVTWTASAAGGEAPYQYRFIVWDGAAWTDARAWGASNVFAWTPGVANADFKVAVLVRSAWNMGANEMTVTRPFAIRPFVTSLPSYADLVSPQATSTTVTFSASAIGGEAPYEYTWVVHDGVSWTTKQTWSPRSEFSWKPGTPGNYRVLVKARSAWNQGAAELSTERSFQLLPAATSVTLTPDVPAPQLVDHTVTFTAAAAGGQGPYQYRWWVDSFVRRDWSTSNVFAWTPDSSGWPHVKVQVRSAAITGPSEREAELVYEIRNPLVLTLSTAQTSPRPADATWPIQWTASVTGGAAPWQFQWFVYDGANWTNVTPWITSNSPTNVFNWSPTVPFAYRVGVRARSAGNTGPAEATVIQSFVIQ